jgi:hypothetical protein
MRNVNAKWKISYLFNFVDESTHKVTCALCLLLRRLRIYECNSNQREEKEDLTGGRLA